MFFAILSSTACCLEAQAQLNLSPPARTTAKPGEQFTIPQQFSNPVGQEIDAFGLKFIFPGAALTYDTVRPPGRLPTAGLW